MIEIDGAFGEGGGQILRTACAFSTIAKKPCRIFNIRKGRPKPGLAFQHLLAVQALAELSRGKTEGGKIGSEEIIFFPGSFLKNRISLNIPTAGSITLILQALIPPALSALEPTKITFKGGATDTFFSPTLDHFRQVFLKILEKAGIKVEIKIAKRGYFPEGGAEVEAKIYPSAPKPLKLAERGDFEKISVFSGASESLKWKKVAERQLMGAREILGKLKLPFEEKAEYFQTRSPGSHICLTAKFENTILGADNLGKLGKRAEEVGKEAALDLLEEQKTEACLDRHSADQILPYLALAKGKSRITFSKISEHCKTNIEIIEKFVKGKYKIEENSISYENRFNQG